MTSPRPHNSARPEKRVAAGAGTFDTGRGFPRGPAGRRRGFPCGSAGRSRSGPRCNRSLLMSKIVDKPSNESISMFRKAFHEQEGRSVTKYTQK
ncbi:hypothetical protein NDU88_007062 [Pleurodeles waltl]|uniref:Uncharacterized protein n=1 Tax=Pleurodeles waltl TaxID=8319 RepID=A0AAV7NRZ9_PLEWA|nr:hypothetical protein NDU88_007062 [Pleurodeles waltl]